MTALQKPDGSLTSDLNKTLKAMIDHLTPNDEQSDDTDGHKRNRTLSTEPIQPIHDRDYTPEEVKNAIDDLKHKKGPEKTALQEKYIRESTNNSLHLFTQYTKSIFGLINCRTPQISCVRQLIKPNIVYKDTTGMTNRMIQRVSGEKLFSEEVETVKIISFLCIVFYPCNI